MMILYGDDAFTIRYLTLIPFALLPLLKTFMMSRCPNRWTCSLENPTRVPLKGRNSDVSMFMPLKASQYNISAKLPRSLTPSWHSIWIYTFMTIRSFSCVSTPYESYLEKLMMTSIRSLSDNKFCDTCIIDQAYLFLDELISPPPPKIIELALSVCRAIWVSRIFLVFFPLLAGRFSEFDSLLEGLLFLTYPSASFTYDIIVLFGSWSRFLSLTDDNIKYCGLSNDDRYTMLPHIFLAKHWPSMDE